MTYDITDKETFIDINKWMSDVNKHASDNVSCILVGNKSDINDARQVSFEEGLQLAQKYGLQFLETSTKNNWNVDEAFMMLVHKILSRDDISKLKKPISGGGHGTSTALKPSVSGRKNEEKRKHCY